MADGGDESKRAMRTLKRSLDEAEAPARVKKRVTSLDAVWQILLVVERLVQQLVGAIGHRAVRKLQAPS